MATIKDNPTLKDLQDYMAAVSEERGWNKADELELFLLFSEEVGELAKAIRNHRNLFQEGKKKRKDPRQNLEEEFADVFSYILDLANHLDVDLEKVFRAKEAINNQRKWS